MAPRSAYSRGLSNHGRATGVRMRYVSLLVLIGVFCSPAALPAEPVAPRSSAAANSSASSAGASVPATGKGGRPVAGLAASSLICSLFGSGDWLADTAAATQKAGARDTDPNHAIQFGRIWTDGHQTTVGRSTVSDPASVIATIKLPITLSAAERKQFDDAGWKAHYDKASHATLYCFDKALRARGQSGAPGEGLLCVTGGN